MILSKSKITQTYNQTEFKIIYNNNNSYKNNK